MTLTMIGTRPGATTGVVRKATYPEIPELAGALARAFAADPMMSWFFPGDVTRPRRLERLFGDFFLPEALAYQGAYTSEDRAGAALWTPPGKAHMSAMDQLRLLPLMARLSGRALPRTLRALAAMEASHPQEPHWYLPIMGIAPDRQGAGLGSALLQPIFDRCDRDVLPAYLEATSTRNRDLYLRLGFAVLGQMELPGGGPVVWRMLRAPAGV